MNLALAFALSLGFVYWATRPVRKISTTEWRERMRRQGLGVK